MYDIIVIGAGTAGMTAAIYARRAAKSVLVLEAVQYGGQIVNSPSIENYPAESQISGFDFATRLYTQAKNLGAEFIFQRVVEIQNGDYMKTVVTKKDSYTGKAVIIATGSVNRRLGLQGEAELVGRGVSYCATCDGAFYKNKTVAVAGGGNTALEDALYLADIAAKVYLIHRRDEFRGDGSTVEALRAKANVEFIYNSNVTRLCADQRLNGIEVTDKDGNIRTIEVAGLFVAVGRIPENRDFSGLIELDTSGYAVAGENCLTGVPGIFVAGDNRAKDVRQLVTAAADGAAAATAAVKYIGSLLVK